MEKSSAARLIVALALISTLTSTVSSQSVCQALNENVNAIPTVRIEPANLTVKRGMTFSVSVIIENIPADPGMVGVQFIMSWDPTVLHALNMTEVMFHNVTPQSERGNIWEIRNTFNNTAGYALYAYTVYDLLGATDGGYLPISGNHTLATATMEAMEAGSTHLRLSDLIVGYYIWSDFQAKVLMCSSDMLRKYSPLLPSVIMDTQILVSPGMREDINGDGAVDLFDALLLAQHFGSKQGDTTWDPSMDMNSDGQLDIFDLIALTRKYGKDSM